jgi:AcrR family transcriptional regulator
MKTRRVDIAAIRRQQVVDAAIAIITERGLENLSLSEIEKRAAMSRGQLTYYFPAKEAILLAVFDRLVVLIHERVGTPAGRNGGEISGWDWVRHLLERLVTGPPVSPEFGCLQYTFLAQMSHRDDLRRRLAGLYESWRSNMALGLAADMAKGGPSRAASPRAVSTVAQALIHGLIMQKSVDPKAFDSQEVVELCLEALAIFIGNKSPSRQKPRLRKANKPAAILREAPRRHSAQHALKGVNGERVSRSRSNLRQRISGETR